MLRYSVHFAGRVQGVGFRYTATEIASRYDLAGYVKNLPDGRVELVAEGEPEELDKFFDELSQTMRDYIRQRTIDKGPANGEFGEPGIEGLRVRH